MSQDGKYSAISSLERKSDEKLTSDPHQICIVSILKIQSFFVTAIREHVSYFIGG